MIKGHLTYFLSQTWNWPFIKGFLLVRNFKDQNSGIINADYYYWVLLVLYNGLGNTFSSKEKMFY